ncbi:MOSC domain-containing protein [Candidatus Woesearchaeota archaeon]|nr:MOSC domain-containing protein [Candidatus Woesearchaeota archaeon]
MAEIVSINVSSMRGTAKQPVTEARLLEEQGIEHDAHAGDGDRQLSLIACESYERFKEENLEKICRKLGPDSLSFGAFAENITTSGIVLHTLPIGTRLRIRDAMLEVSKIGKECHAGCEISKKVGSCIMPREGIFARVLKGGIIRQGDPIELL